MTSLEMITAFVDTSYVLSKESKTFHSSAPRELKERNTFYKSSLCHSFVLLTNSMEQSPSWKANRFSASQIPTLYGTRIFVTMTTSAHHLSLSSARSIQSMHPHATLWRSILSLSSHLCLHLQNGLFPQVSPPKPCMHPCSCPYVPHLVLDLITWIIFGEEYRSFSSSLCSFLHSPLTLSLLGSNIPLSTLFSNTASLHSSLNVRNHVLHPYKLCVSETINS